MTRLVTLAHRVSGIYTRSSKIHTSIFAFSLSRLIPGWDGASPPKACRYQSHLAELQRELEEPLALVVGGQELEPATTLGREFTQAMEEYIVALLDSIEQLAIICGRLCRDKKGLEPYGAEQFRGDRVTYDRSVQIYQRCGERLSFLFSKL